MLEEYLSQNEGKTLEFKENTRSLAGIIKTVVSFANTSGGVIIIGVRDQTKDIVGVPEPLKEEERIANAISDSISPLIIPDIEIHTYRDRALIIVRVPHAAGPFYLKADGPKNGVYISLVLQIVWQIAKFEILLNYFQKIEHMMNFPHQKESLMK